MLIVIIQKQAAHERGQTDRIILTFDLLSPVSHGHDLLTCKLQNIMVKGPSVQKI